jgi:RNA polymerase sigma-70 factor, ECF subfamily
MGLKNEIREALLTDDELVQRIKDGETWLFEIIMRRYNQRLFRVIRGVVRNDTETEEVMQEAWVRAYEHLHQFQGRSSFSTWLTKIAVYDAFARIRKGQRTSAAEEYPEHLMASTERTPEQRTFDSEMHSMLEAAVDSLSDEYRAVLMMRDIEGLSTTETADCLDITEENVKVRLHRARASVRKYLLKRAGAASSEAFQFLGARCDRMVERVLQRIQG